MTINPQIQLPHSLHIPGPKQTRTILLGQKFHHQNQDQKGSFQACINVGNPTAKFAPMFLNKTACFKHEPINSNLVLFLIYDTLYTLLLSLSDEDLLKIEINYSLSLWFYVYKRVRFSSLIL